MKTYRSDIHASLGGV